MRLRNLGLSMVLGLAVVAGVLVILSSGAGVAAAGRPFEPASSGELPRANGTISTAHVVVVFSGEKTAVREIAWTAAISNVAALRAAGFDVETDIGNPDTICSIDGDGCPAEDCWCASNWWWQGRWDEAGEAWDSPYPAPLVENGDAVGFRNSTDWGQPVLPAPSYIAGLKALEWLRPRQNLDTGAYGNTAGTLETLLIVEANQWDAAQWRRQADAPSLLHNLYSNGALYAKNAGESGKTAVGLAASGGCWPVGGTPPQDFYNETTGEYANAAVNQAWAILGTKALGYSIPATATQALKDMITANGGWGWPGWGEDTDTTALAVQALVVAGESPTSTHVVSGLNFLKTRQNTDGGFNPGWSDTTSAASTGSAVLAILAAGQDPITGTWLISNSNPISYLVHTQQENGSFLYGSNPDELETRQATLALLGGRLPLATKADLPLCYGLSGHVTGIASQPITDVIVSALGWNEAGIRTTNDASGYYTISVPETRVYTVTPKKAGHFFIPPWRAVSVEGGPGDIAPVDDFVVGIPYFMPLTIRH